MDTRKRSHLDIYGGKNPTEMPAYLLADAAHYLRLSATTVRSWVLGREYQTESGLLASRPLIVPADPKNLLLSFLNLVELHVLSSIRRVHRVKPRAVRRAIEYLRKRYHSAHPLLDQQMLTDGKSLFIEQYGEVVNISTEGQMEMKVLLDAYLKRIKWDEKGIPIRLFPFTREEYDKAPSFVSIDPRIRSGKPCISGTGIPTSIIAERREAGDSIALLAKDYGRSQEEIAEAIRYESRAAS